MFWLGSPLKIALWLGNRLVTATGLLVLWRRLKGMPDRPQRFFVWVVGINAVSIGLLVGIWWLVAHR